MSDFIEAQRLIIEIAIAKAGSAARLGEILSVRRETVLRWHSGKHRITGDFLIEVLKWIGEEETARFLGSMSVLTGKVG